MDILNQNKDRRTRKKSSLDLSTIVYGKIPPQARELEEAVLGCLMLERSAFDIVCYFIRPEVFYVDAHQKIYQAIQELSQRSEPVDILTVTEQLKKFEWLEEIGGPYYILKLTSAVSSSANIEYYSKIILQKFLQREVIRISGEMCGLAYEDTTDAFELIDDFQKAAFDLDKNFSNNHIYTMGDNMVEFYNNLDARRAHSDKLTGITSGYRELDICTNGWQPTDFIILAARPSIGKTALAVNFARKAVLSNTPVPVGFFSLEMSKSQIVERLMSAETLIPLARIRRGKLSDEEYDQTMKVTKRIEQAPLYIDDTASLNWMEFRVKARRLAKKYKVGLIILDYLQLMSDVKDGSPRNREQQISNITREIKKLAKELNLPIIALSQLSRAVETRGSKNNIPQLSDLRESGAIEQDADVVAFIYKPDIVDTAGETYIKIAKHRNGALEVIKLIGKLHVQCFYSPDDPLLREADKNSDTWQPAITYDLEDDKKFSFKAKT